MRTDPHWSLFERECDAFLSEQILDLGETSLMCAAFGSAACVCVCVCVRLLDVRKTFVVFLPTPPFLPVSFLFGTMDRVNVTQWSSVLVPTQPAIHDRRSVGERESRDFQRCRTCSEKTHVLE